MPVQPLDVNIARNLIPTAKEQVGVAIEAILKDNFNIDYKVDITKDFTTPKADCGDLSVQFFTFVKMFKPIEADFKAKHPKNSGVNPPAIAEFFQAKLQEIVDSADSPYLKLNGKCFVKSMNMLAGYLNINLTQSFHGQLITSVIFGQYLKPTLDTSKDRVMIEYSQPNTHKAFHVGHMRNAALGDCLTRLYEQNGHKVTPVNYFGDEGAHVAKCLWYLQSFYLPRAQEAYKKGLQYDPTVPNSVYPIRDMDDLENAIPVPARAEWLGELYTEAVNLLDLSLYTSMAWPQVVAGKVISKVAHPDATAPHNWNLCQVEYGAASPATVVCGGVGYKVGDLVAYLPVGAKLNKKMGIVAPKDMKGIESHGVMLAFAELGEDAKLTPEQIAEYKELLTPPKAPEAAVPEAEAAPVKGAKGKAKGKKVEELTAEVVQTKVIMTLPADAVIGNNLAEVFKNEEYKQSGTKVMDVYNALKKQASDVLLKLEHQEPESVALWQRTGKWSLDEFHRIYNWLGCRFDRDFTESEVSEPSRVIVEKMYADGLLVKKDGAVVCDLNEYNLGYCVLLKSDGAGLYATKDLALAQVKFDQYKVDKSIYVVDSAQSYHFAQVFKTLELTGYPQAKKCVHLPYGIVTLPSGRMSSRKGNVMLFSQLRSTMEQVLQEKYGKDAPLHPEVVRRIAVASIRYGMLNHDTSKDIVFDLEKWTNNIGNTGPYLLYAYSRITSILQIRDTPDTTKFDFAPILQQLGCDYTGFTSTCPVTQVTTMNWTEWLVSPGGQKFLELVDFDKYLTEKIENTTILNLYRFWPLMQHAIETNNPSPLCDYVFSVAQSFSGWYEQVRLRALTNEQIPTKIVFLLAIKDFIAQVCAVLGFQTLDRM